MSGLVYLASPYSHPDPLVKAERFRQACTVAGKMMKEGQCVFSPIAHSHPIEQYFEDGSVEGHDFWLKQDFAVLSHCAKLVVLAIDGWERSKGVAAEIEFAQQNQIPLEFLVP
jgi:hypothetical protein